MIFGLSYRAAVGDVLVEEQHANIVLSRVTRENHTLRKLSTELRGREICNEHYLLSDKVLGLIPSGNSRYNLPSAASVVYGELQQLLCLLYLLAGSDFSRAELYFCELVDGDYIRLVKVLVLLVASSASISALMSILGKSTSPFFTVTFAGSTPNVPSVS